jgi:hypothetical protein
MPALIPTDHVAEVVWLGVTPDRSAALQSAPREVLRLSFAGPEGEDHAGLTRPSDSRVLAQYTRGTEIRNVRQLSILSEEDIAAIARRWAFRPSAHDVRGDHGVARDTGFHAHPAVVAAAGRGERHDPDRGHGKPALPPGVQRDRGAHPGFGKAFKPAAAGRRGVTAWVEREGEIRLGAKLRLHIPDQPHWPHAEAARSA